MIILCQGGFKNYFLSIYSFIWFNLRPCHIFSDIIIEKSIWYSFSYGFVGRNITKNLRIQPGVWNWTKDTTTMGINYFSPIDLHSPQFVTLILPISDLIDSNKKMLTYFLNILYLRSLWNFPPRKESKIQQFHILMDWHLLYFFSMLGWVPLFQPYLGRCIR